MEDRFGTIDLPIECWGKKQSETRKYRDAVCKALNLEFKLIAHDGNCFFEALSLVLQPQCTAAQLRASCVELFQNSLDSTQPFFERIVVEMENELHEELVCSNRRSGMNGFKPGSVTEYIHQYIFSHITIWNRQNIYM